MPIDVTPKAIQEIHAIIKAKGIPDFYGLRVGIKGGGGCGGFSYMLGFDLKKEGDAEFNLDGLKLLIDKKHVMYLAGKVIDYVDDGEESGFTFEDK